jgi:Peptidase family C25
VSITTPTFRTTEYYIAPGTGAGFFTGATYNLTLAAALSSNYFVIIQGSDLNGATDLAPNLNYVSLTGDPFATGAAGAQPGLANTGSSTVLAFTRGVASGGARSWSGVITVVECMNDCAASGFQLRDVVRVTHTGATTGPTAITGDYTWGGGTAINQIMLMGGFNGAGCDTAETQAQDTKVCHARIWPSGTNTVNWSRDATGAASMTVATSTVMVLQWGTQWTVQRVNVAGGNGGADNDLATEYDHTALGTAVARARTWVWGTGSTADVEARNASEGALITLGDGVVENATESQVAVGVGAGRTKDFEVYALTHASLSVDHIWRAAAAGDTTVTTFDLATTTAGTRRIALSYNGSNDNNNSYPSPMFSARYLTDSSIRLERRRAAGTIPSWTQGIDFSNVGATSGPFSPGHVPAGLVVPADGYTIPVGGTLTLTYSVAVSSSPSPALTQILNTASVNTTQQTTVLSASASNPLVLAGVTIDPDNSGFVKTSAADQTITFYHHVTNTGTASDSFNLTLRNEAGWRVELIDPASGGVIATDTNGDGVWDAGAIVNTGSMAPNAVKNYLVRLRVPAGTPATAPPMTPMSSSLTAISTSNPAIKAKATDEVTVLGSGSNVEVLPDQSGVVNNAAGSFVAYTHLVVNNTGAAETFDLTASSKLGWTTRIYVDTNNDGIFSNSDVQVANTAVIPSGGSQRVFLVMTVPAGGVAAGTTDVSLLRAQSRTNAVNYDVVSDTTTAVAPTAMDLAGGGTRYAAQSDVTIYPGTLSNFSSSADRFNLSIGPSTAIGADTLSHPTQLWIDTNADGIVDTLIATDNNGDGVWDSILAGYNTDSGTGNLQPDVPVPANGTLAYELRRTIPAAMVIPQEFVTLTAKSIATSTQVDSVTAQFILVTVTRATLTGLRVDPKSGTILFATGTQQGTRGFNLYEVSGPGPVAGLKPLSDTMILAPVSTSLTPIVYEAHTRPLTQPYLLIEEVEVTGRHRVMGPFSVQDPVLAQSLDRVQARLARAGDGVSARPQARLLTTRGLRSLAAAERGPARRALSAWRAARDQASVAAGAKVRVSKAGQVRVSLTQLRAAGLPNVSASALRLTRFGQPVPFSRSGEWMTFTATALSTDYTGENVYVFTPSVPAASPVVALTRSEAPPAANARRIERNALYDPHIPFGLDPWLWDLLYPGIGPWPYGTFGGPDFGKFDLPNMPSLGSLPTDIPVRIQVMGGTYHQHTMTASINGQLVGSVTFSGGVTAGTINGTVSASALLTSGNQLSIDYTPLALFDGPAADSAVGGLNYLDIELPVAGTPAATFELDAYDPSLGTLSGTEYLIVTHPLFRDQADRMADLKRAQGFTTRVVDVERAYDRFTGGVVEAEAVRALIRYTAAAGGKLKYVLLVGDDTFDPQDFMGYGSVSYVPSLMSYDTLFGRIPSENVYADLNADGIPDVAIGRMPVQTPAEADVMIDKIEAYTATPRALADRHFFVADNSTETDTPFRQDAQGMAARLPAGSSISFVDVIPDMTAARASLQSNWQNGAFAAHYFGHGSPQLWADEQILSPADVPALATSRPPIVFQWACSTGWYQYLGQPSLSEALVLAPRGGAVATFAPTGITSPAGQRSLFEQVYNRLQAPPATLGELIRQSKGAALLNGGSRLQPVVDGWNLLGDPALPLAP